MYIYSQQLLFEELSSHPKEKLHNRTKEFLALCEKEFKTEDEQKIIDCFVLDYSREKWELTEYLIDKGLYIPKHPYPHIDSDSRKYFNGLLDKISKASKETETNPKANDGLNKRTRNAPITNGTQKLAISRTQPCECGSGYRYENCHGLFPQSAEQ